MHDLPCNTNVYIQIYSYDGYLAVGESTAPTSADPIAMMEFYMKKAAQEEKKRQPKQSKDEMPPPASLQGFFLVISFVLFLWNICMLVYLL